MTTLDILIPAHNEAAVIVPTLRTLSEALRTLPDLDWRIVVVENGSVDDTALLVEGAKLPHIEVFSSQAHGKGAALKDGAAKSDADYLAFLDADLSVAPESLIHALEYLKQGNHLVIGSRFHPDTQSDRGTLRQASSRVFNLLAQRIVGVQANDTQCPLKIMDNEGKHHLLACVEDTWFLDLELIARVERAGLALAVVPIVWTEFRYPKRKSKLNIYSDGAQAVRTMFRLRKQLASERE
jgi:glycosyltransferase involved in cell wall biosynthesis